MQKIFLVSLLWVGIHSGALTQTPVLVKEINPGISFGIWSSQSAILNDKLYFIGDDPTNGEELWVSDGTESGTYMIKDIYPGTNYPGVTDFLIPFKGKLYFRGVGPNVNTELWSTDGTEAGTVLHFEGCPGDCQSNISYMVSNGDTAFFSLNAQGQTELYYTDGTTAGTGIVTDISGPIFSSGVSKLVTYNGKVYFSADGEDGNYFELWVSDGTESGTHLVKNLSPVGSSEPGVKIVYGDYFYFLAKSNITGRELYKSDGTEAGTVLVKDINLGTGDGVDPNYDFTNSFYFNGKIYFRGNDGVSGEELWSTDGTEAGTQLVKDINPGNGDSDPIFMGELNGQLIFSAITDDTGRELWISDGTEAGTQMLVEINPTGSGPHFILPSMQFQNFIFFIGDDGVNGRELWVTDGTVAGTEMVADLDPSAEAWPNLLGIVNNTLFFSAQTPASGRELWKLDLTPLSTKSERPEVTFVVTPSISETAQFGITYQTKELKGGHIQVSNINGQIIFNQDIQPGYTPINFGSSAPGIYFITVFEPNATPTTKKFVLTRSR
ncbi:MAG: T9SS type A sorting domain-containing protein [Saprospiraceae bacterium]